MSSLDLNDGAPAVRPKSLSASSLWGRAVFGLVVLFTGTFLSAWLYDTTIRANASTTPAKAPTALVSDPISAIRADRPGQR